MLGSSGIAWPNACPFLGVSLSMNYSESFRKLRSQVGHESNDTSEYANCLDNLPGLTFGVRIRNFAPPAGFELVNEPNCERGGTLTMPAGKNPMLPITVFTDYI